MQLTSMMFDCYLHDSAMINQVFVPGLKFDILQYYFEIISHTVMKYKLANLLLLLAFICVFCRN